MSVSVCVCVYVCVCVCVCLSVCLSVCVCGVCVFSHVIRASLDLVWAVCGHVVRGALKILFDWLVVRFQTAVYTGL